MDKNRNFSELTLVLTGHPSIFFQSGSSSSKALVSNTFPLNIWAPTSDAFSTTHTFVSAFNCLSLMAVDSPDGPPPTITTS